MGVVENIMSAVILMFILLVSGLIYMISSAHDIAYSVGVKEDVFKDDSNINNLNNVLKITDPDSGRNIGVLLADAVYYRNDTLEFNNKQINITRKVSELLDMAYTNKDFYLVVKPRIIEVSMNFVIDGSPSLQEERDMLADNLQDIISSIELKLNLTNQGYQTKVSENPVIANVYILGSKQEKCDQFTNLADSRINCHILNNNHLYLKRQNANSSDTFINMSEYNLDAFLLHYNMTPPFGYDWVDNISHYAPESDYYESDWGYGIGYASNFDKKTSLSRLTLLFPMGDELSTSSIADACFYVQSGDSHWPEYVDCQLCNNNCPIGRSLESVNKGIEIALDNKHVINPIFSYSCDFEYKSDYDVAYDAFHHNPDGTTSNACKLDSCQGCSFDGTGVCYHPECSADIVQQMETMANRTGGQVIDLADIATMDVNIRDTIENNIDQYTLVVGDMYSYRERDVIETTQPLPNGQLVDIRLWVYKN